MSFETLSNRLSALQETNEQVRELIYRLSSLHFQPGSIPLEGSEGDVSQELSEEIGELMRDQADELEELELEVTDLPVGTGRTHEKAEDKEELLGGVKRASTDLKTYAITLYAARIVN